MQSLARIPRTTFANEFVTLLRQTTSQLQTCELGRKCRDLQSSKIHDMERILECDLAVYKVQTELDGHSSVSPRSCKDAYTMTETLGEVWPPSPALTLCIKLLDHHEVAEIPK